MSGHRITNDKDSHFYSVTKFAVTALTEGTRNELAKVKSKIRITVKTSCFTKNFKYMYIYSTKSQTNFLAMLRKITNNYVDNLSNSYYILIKISLIRRISKGRSSRLLIRLFYLIHFFCSN